MELLARFALSYLLHSTVLLGAAVVVRLALRERRLALQEAVLRAALVGGFVTAGLQLGLDVRPVAGAVPLPGPSLAADVDAPLSLAFLPPAEPSPPSTGRAAVSRTRAPLGSVLAPLPDWRLVLFTVWAGLAAIGLARLAVAAVRLNALLRDRRPLEGHEIAPAAARLAGALGLRRPVPLSAAPRLTVPLATGVLRPEVCLPARAVCEMPAEEQVALCAHELAHVARRDPAWVLAARLVEAIAPLQPLNAWARRRLQDLAECLSDDLAIGAAGHRLGLARSLVDVASWLGERTLLPAAAAGALSARSRLGHRVERLMDLSRAPERPRPSFLLLAGLLVLATTLVTPVVSGSATGEDPTPAPAAAAPAQDKAQPQVEQAPTPAPDVRASQDARRELEEIARQIEGRARLSEAESAKLQAEIEAMVANVEPHQAEIERLSRELASSAADIAATLADGAGQETERAANREKRDELRQRMAEVRRQLREATREGLREEEVRALREKARELAERTRPTAEELRRIRELSRQLARDAGTEARETSRISREASDQLRDAMRQLREAMRTVREEMRRAGREAGRSLRSPESARQPK